MSLPAAALPSSSPAPRPGFLAALPLLCLAVGAPSLLAFNISPSATVLNQVAAVALWGGVLAALGGSAARSRTAAMAMAAPAFALLVCALACAFSGWAGALPAPLALSSFAFLAAACLVALHGAGTPARVPLPTVFFSAWLIAGLFSAAIAYIQVFAPQWADGSLIAPSGLAGRAVGNVRQPNHLAGLLLWSCVGLVPLLEARLLRFRLGALLMALFVPAIVLSASRTGVIGVVLLAGWGLVDRRLSRRTRVLLVLAPVAYALGWALTSWWAAESHHTFGAAARLAEKDLSGSRFGIWRDTLALIRKAPWTGVGWGEFNFAWSLTPFPHRPVAFFDHTHNLGLQLIVELGLPLGLLVIGLLLLALWQAFRRTWLVEGAEGAALRAAFVCVLLTCVHSALEYPLWYGYFLLPTAWAWGFALGGQRTQKQRDPTARAASEASTASTASAASAAAPPAAPSSRAFNLFLRTGGVLMLAGSLFAISDYLQVSRIFDPGDDVRPLEQRVADGQRSIFFAHHADYAAATVAERPSDAWSAFRRAPHYLLDTRLMVAWAKAFAERGDLDRARHIAARLREFHNPQSQEFFAPCEAPGPVEGPPWQCQPPSRAMDWRDFKSLAY